jgi:hypothetical protein
VILNGSPGESQETPLSGEPVKYPRSDAVTSLTNTNPLGLTFGDGNLRNRNVRKKQFQNLYPLQRIVNTQDMKSSSFGDTTVWGPLE